ncbi:MAG: helix-turn-helix domain-containing protein [Oscillospiraceae bacterium]
MLSKQLRVLRKQKGFTQQEIADFLKIHRTTYASYELGRIRPDVAMLVTLSKLYLISLDVIMEVDNKKESKLYDEANEYDFGENSDFNSTLTNLEKQLVAYFRISDNKEEIIEMLKKNNNSH